MSASPTTRQVASCATSTGPGSVARACASAVDQLGRKPGLLLAFASGELDQDAAATAIAKTAGTAPSAGLTGHGLLTLDGQLEEGCVAMALGPVEAAVGVAVDAHHNLRAAGESATAEALAELGAEPDIALMFIDSSHGDIADTLAGAYAAAGPNVPLAGGAASGPGRWHFHGGRATSDSVVAVAISSERPITIAETQTASVTGAPAIVTASEGQRVIEIDGRPAQDVYLEQIGFAGIPLEDEEFAAISITHPISQPELHGERRLRHVLGRNEAGELLVGTHVPAGAAIEFTELGLDELISSGARSVEQAVSELGVKPQAALVFDCAGRRRALGPELGREVEAVAAALGSSGAQLAGLYTNSEVARLKGAKGDRNHAVVTVAFG